MSRIYRRISPSYIALVAAVALGASPAFAATTTVTAPAGTTQTSAVTASPAAGDTIIVDIDGVLRGFSAAAVNSVIVQGSGVGAVNIIGDGRLQGRFNFPSATGPITVTINSGDNAATEGWFASGTTTFGSDADTINNTAAGTIALQATAFGTTILNFGAGADTFDNAGRLIVGQLTPTSSSFFWESIISLTNLETFNNSGLIVMGSYFSVEGDDGDLTDGQVNDRLIANGMVFTGSGDSRIAFDVHLGATAKADCSIATIADCVDFTGGSTAGSTLLTINNAAVSTNEAGLGIGRFNEGITLITGSSAAGHFSLDPATAGYVDTAAGGALEVGLVRYQLAYDAVGKRHMLVSTLPSTAGAQAIVFTGTAQEVWHATTGSWFTRQADLRHTPGGLASSKGLWGRISTGESERDALLSAAQDDDAGDYALKVRQRTSQLVFGGDILRGTGGGGAWVAGLMLGAMRTDADYQSTDMKLTYAGFTGGGYASYIAGPLFVDAIINVNILDVEGEIPNIGLTPLDRLNGKIESLGGQIEAGWRVPVAAGLSVEPLAAVAYVRTKLGDVEAGSGVRYEFDPAKSLRAGAGLRGAYETQLMGMPASLSLTGRYWNESEGQNGARLVMSAGEATLSDELPGSYSQLDAGLNLFSDDGLLSGFVNVGGKFADDYEAMDASVGVRLRW